MAKKINIELLDFTSGDSLSSVSVINGGEFVTSSASNIVGIVENGAGQPNPTTSATITFTTSGSGTPADPFVITGVNVTGGGSGYNSTIRILVTGGVITNPVLIPVLNQGVIGQLDITDSEDFPLSLNFQVSDGKNIESRFGDFSKSFEIPATKNNNRIFQHIYNSQVVNTKNIYHIKDCRILVDSIEFFRGKIQLQGSKQDKNPKSYSCTIYGGNFSWVNEIKDKRLCDLEFASAGTQTFDYTNILASHTKNQSNSEIIYPLVSYGDFNPDDNTGGVNVFDTDMTSYDWRGWFWVYNIIKEIFRNIGFTLDSSFIETANFKKLITNFNFYRGDKDALAMENGYRAEINRVDASSSNFQMILGSDINSLTQGVQPPTTVNEVILKYDTPISDVQGSYDTTTGKWTCALTGRYRITASANIVFGVNPPSTGGAGNYTSRMRFRLIHRDASGTLIRKWTNVFYPNSLYSPAGSTDYGFFPSVSKTTQDPASGSSYIYVQQGETVEAALQCEFVNQSGMASSTRVSIAFGGIGGVSAFANQVSQFLVEYDSTELQIGSTFEIPQMLPCDVKQIDFIKGISHMFNLQFYTDVQSKKIYAEPYDDFYGNATDAFNWSSKVDYSQGIQDKYEIGLNEEVLFKYKDDSADEYVEYLNTDDNGNALENPVFAYYLNLGDKFPKGKKEFVNPLFAPTAQDWDNDVLKAPYNNGVMIPVLWKEVPPSETIGHESIVTQPVERPEKGFKYLPRIAYYHGSIVNPNSANNLTQWTAKLSTSQYTESGVYPRATFVDFEDASFPSLSYNDETVEPPKSGTSTLVKGLYSTYYEKMVSQMLLAPRIRTVYMNLKVQDVINIDLRKLVFFDGNLWRINRIVDFSPAKNTATKVEFIQWFEV